MKTKTIKLYSFEELDEEVQRELVRDKQDKQSFLPYQWYYPIVEQFIEEAEDLGFEFKNGVEDITFSLYDRESHFGIITDNFWFKTDAVDGYYLTAEVDRGANKFGYYFNGFPTRGWFTSECRAWIDELVDEDDELVDEDDDRFEEVEEELNSLLAGLNELCKKYYKLTLKEYESHFEEDYIREELKSWGEVFREEGSYEYNA